MTIFVTLLSKIWNSLSRKFDSRCYCSAAYWKIESQYVIGVNYHQAEFLQSENQLVGWLSIFNHTTQYAIL